MKCSKSIRTPSNGDCSVPEALCFNEWTKIDPFVVPAAILLSSEHNARQFTWPFIFLNDCVWETFVSPVPHIYKLCRKPFTYSCNIRQFALLSIPDVQCIVVAGQEDSSARLPPEFTGCDCLSKKYIYNKHEEKATGWKSVIDWIVELSMESILSYCRASYWHINKVSDSAWPIVQTKILASCCAQKLSVWTPADIYDRLFRLH